MKRPYITATAIVAALHALAVLIVSAIFIAIPPHAHAQGRTTICDPLIATQCVKVDALGNLHSSPGASSSTPSAGASSAIATGGAPVTLITGPVNGCYVVNPASATDQNIATAENAFVNIVGAAGSTGNGTTVTLAPGQTFSCPAGMTTNLSANAATSGHALTVTKW